MSRCAGAGRERSQAASQSWAMEIFHTMDAMISLSMGVGSGEQELSFPGVQSILLSLNFICEFCLFPTSSASSVKLVNCNKICELQALCGFHDCCSGTGCTTGCQRVRKIVLCIACFAYLLLLFFLSLFPLLSY